MFLYSHLRSCLFFILLLTVFLCCLGILTPTFGRDLATVSAEVLLQRAYPDLNMSFSEVALGSYVLIQDERFLFSPKGGCPGFLPDRTATPPLCALFSQKYPLGEGGRYPTKSFDPGRLRNEAFLKLLYGQNKEEVKKNNVLVNFLGVSVFFNQKHGAATALTRVSIRLKKAMQEKPQIKEYIYPICGTFYWRKVKNSSNLSAHAFGIAIDLNTKKGVYWLWQPSAFELEKARREFPQEIVEAFEAEGFIWGGKWFSFDFMHFEYRPELTQP